MIARRTTLTLMLLLGLTSIARADGKTRLFILSGQSNMAGLDPDVSFTPTVNQAFEDDTVIVVKYAVGGQPIRRWFKDWKLPEGKEDDPKVAKLAPGDMYDRLMAMVGDAMKDKTADTVTFVWMQGENDAKRGWDPSYEAAMRGLIEQLRTDLKRKDVGFVIGRLSDCNNGDASWDAVRAAQAKVAEGDKLGAWVDTDDLNGDQNALHYTRDGYKELGKRFAEKAIEVTRKAEASP